MPDFATPSETSPLRALLISVVIIVAVSAAVFFLNPRKTADLTVTHVDLFSPHTKFASMSGDGAHVIGSAENAEDDLYVVVNVHLKNKLRLPIFANGWAATMTAPDGTESEASAIDPADFPRLTKSFPQLAPMLTHALGRDTKADPGKSFEGGVLLLFPNAKESDWKTKKSAALTLNLAHQQPQTVALP